MVWGFRAAEPSIGPSCRAIGRAVRDSKLAPLDPRPAEQPTLALAEAAGVAQENARRQTMRSRQQLRKPPTSMGETPLIWALFPRFAPAGVAQYFARLSPPAGVTEPKASAPPSARKRPPVAQLSDLRLWRGLRLGL